MTPPNPPSIGEPSEQRDPAVEQAGSEEAAEETAEITVGTDVPGETAEAAKVAVPGGSEVRPLRAHARRNRDKLIAAARAAFASGEGTVALESIAQSAGVGIATLYRHFPTREALVETVYAAELDDVTSSARPLLDELAPPEALRAWMERYARFSAAKHGEISVLRAAWASGRITRPTRERITAELRLILDAGARDGSLRADADAADVTTLLLGIFLATADATPQDRAAQIARLLDLAIDALRSAGGPPATPAD